MEAGLLNYLITHNGGSLIKRITVNRKLEVRIPKFGWTSDELGSNLKEITFCIQLQL